MDTPNFEDIKRRFNESDPMTKAEIASWEKRYKTASLMNNFYAHDAIKLLSEELNTRIDGLNVLLQDDRKQTGETLEDFYIRRLSYFERRDAYKWFLGLFKMSQSAQESVEAKVEALPKTKKEE